MYNPILTAIGKAKIADAIANNTTVNITNIAVGDSNGTHYNPVESQTELVNEVYRTGISSMSINPSNPSLIEMIGIIPSDVGGFTIREVAIFDTDGDMIAVSDHPDFDKFVLDSSASSLEIKFMIAVTNTDAITLIIQEDVYASADDVERIKNALKDNIYIKPKNRRGRTLFIKTAPAEITIPKGFKVATIDGFSANLEDDVVISLDNDLDTGTKEAGRDYLVYMTQEGNFYFKLFVGTFDSSDLLIGGLHYGLVPENATLPASTPNKTEADMVNNRGIKAYSMWDLTHRPATANPFGKVLVANKFWRNIYLVDEEYAIRGYSSCYKIGSSTIAKIAGGAETNGRKFPKIPLMYGGNGTANYGRLSYFTACELNSACGMRNPNYSEFSESSYGVREEKSARELGYETGTGNIKHFPMLESKWGVEQATGVQWTWSSDLMNGYGSTDFENRLNQTEGRGYMYATTNSPVSALFGGQEEHTSTRPVGSRALYLANYVWSSTWSTGVVGVCDHLNLDTVSENEL